MKKLLKALIAAVLAVGVFTALSACGNDGQKLSYGKEYVSSDYVNSEDANTARITFNKDGTGSYKKYYKYESEIDKYNFTNDYVITFKYIVIDDVVICSYDSIEYGQDETRYDTPSGWEFTAAFSEKILMTTGGTVYYCETYIPEIPNFNEPEDTE